MTQLLNLSETAELLNFPEEEVMEFVRQKKIPHLYYPKEEKYLFPKEEVLSAITPRPKKETKEPIFPRLVARRGRPKNQT